MANVSEGRKSKRDKKSKGTYSRYKKGGRNRATSTEKKK